MVCCFTGHRFINTITANYLAAKLDSIISSYAAAGFVEFRCGGALGFDTVAAFSVLRVRAQNPAVRLHLCLPCRDQADRWRAADRERYQYLLQNCDSVEYISDFYTSDCMHRRNRALVDGADACIAFCGKTTGGSAYTVAYAASRGVSTLNLFSDPNLPR